MSAIRYAVLAGGFFFYFFAITSLLRTIKEQNFNKMFLRLVDYNSDGILTSKEVKDFVPCQKYDPKRINRQFMEFGRKVDLNDLADQINPKIVTLSLKNCVGNTEQLTDASYIQALKKSELQTQLLNTYDYDGNKEVKWSEFYIGNFIKKSDKASNRAIFQFFDKNHDWKISHRQILKARVSGLADFLGGAKKRRRTRAGSKK